MLQNIQAWDYLKDEIVGLNYASCERGGASPIGPPSDTISPPPPPHPDEVIHNLVFCPSSDSLMCSR